MYFSFESFFIVFLTLHQVLVGSSFVKEDDNLTDISSKLLTLLQRYKNYIKPPLSKNELFCKCSDFECDKEITEIVGDKYSGICRAGLGGVCHKLIHKEPSGTVKKVAFSCLHRHQLVPLERPFICENVTSKRFTQIVTCCKSRSFCNDEELILEVVEPGPGSNLPWYILILLFVAVFFSALGLCVGIFWCDEARTKRAMNCFISPLVSLRNRSAERVTRFRNGRANASRLDKLLDDLEMTTSTGSGAGMPILAQRTISRQITLNSPCIGRGRFGEVYVGEWRGEKVAVKIFLSRDEASWNRETEIYRTNMLRHTNLLRWIASDNKDTGTSTQLWLITEYLPCGSLFDYLEQYELNAELSVQFIRSIAHGLAYLHTEVPGVHNNCFKPGIAHRDLKSKNILLKNDLTCAIADLGMAVRCVNGEIDLPGHSRGGTMRYLAPEFLSDNFVNDSFNAYLQMDVYAFALVIWEICRRVKQTSAGINSCPFEVPYFEFVQREPEMEEMCRCVLVEQRRPTIPESWAGSPIMFELSRIMSECWNTNPNSRLTALNIRYSADKLVESHNLKITV